MSGNDAAATEAAVPAAGQESVSIGAAASDSPSGAAPDRSTGAGAVAWRTTTR